MKTADRKVPHARFAVGQDGLARAQSAPAPEVTSAPLAVGGTVTLALKRSGKQLVEGTVVSIGRKWVTVKAGRLEYRFALPTAPYPSEVALDGGDYLSPGRVLLDPAKVEADSARGKAWRELRELVMGHHQPPQDLSLEAMAAARKVLGL